jgi:hypothetical protein
MDARPWTIPEVIGLLQHGLTYVGRRISVGVLQGLNHTLAPEPGCSAPALGNSLGDEEQFGPRFERQNGRLV